MSADEISDRVFAFIAERIDTVPQLEALLLLSGDSERAWSAEELASRIYVDTDVARAILRALERRGLAAESGGTARYCYESAWDATGTLMAEVAAAYRTHVVRIATFIHAGSSASVREFARAFQFNKDR